MSVAPALYADRQDDDAIVVRVREVLAARHDERPDVDVRPKVMRPPSAVSTQGRGVAGSAAVGRSR